MDHRYEQAAFQSVSTSPTLAKIGNLATPAPPQIDELHGSVEMLNKDLYELVSATRAQADSLFGPQPETDGGAKGNNPAVSRLDGLRLAVEVARSLTYELRDQINRFSRL